MDYFEEEDFCSEEYSEEFGVSPTKKYNPNGKSYPLKLKVREPTPEDLIKANEKGTTNSDENEFQFKKLTKEQAEHLDKRLPALEEEKDDKKEFFKREKSMKPPVTGDTIEQSFPPSDAFDPPKPQEEFEATELNVDRFLPEGKVNMAPHLSVTFNQSMIKLSSIEEVEAQNIPVEISPKVEGKFRWIGTKTLFFEPKFRFNMSTKYDVKIPKGTKSQSGLSLSEDFKWSFETPAVKVISHLPYTSQSTFEDPIFYLEFDQKINSIDVLKTIKLKDDAKSEIGKLELLSNEKAIEISKSQKASYRQNIEYFIQSAVEGRYMLFRCSNKLGLGKNYSLVVGPKVPSAEGPKINSDAYTINFSTYGFMQYSSHYPKGNDPCLPYQSWNIQFSNNIQIDDLDPDETIIISPKLPGVKYNVYSNTINIMGRSKGRTKYTVTVKTSLQDVYGQNLDKDAVVDFNVGSADKALRLFTDGISIIDPTEITDPDVSFISCNITQIRCVVFQVHPNDYYRSPWGSNGYSPNYNQTPILEKYCSFGKKVFDKVISVDSKPDEPVETLFKISEYLQFPKEKLGQIMVLAEPVQTEWKGDWKYRPILKTWIQSTEIAIDTFSNYSSLELTCWANSLKDGSPIEGVDFYYRSKKFSTDKSGIATSTLQTSDYSNTLLYATKGNDITFTNNMYGGSPPRDYQKTFIFNDRNLYKPKEKVTIKGFVRNIKRNKIGYTVEETDKNFVKIGYYVYDPRGANYAKGTITKTATGSFQLSFDLPDNVNLGQHYVTFSIGPNTEYHYFQVQEFKTPEYRVSASSSSGPHVGHSSAIVTVNASYYSGGGLVNADANWTVSQQISTYRPPGHSTYAFQKSIPYWYYSSLADTDFVDEMGPIPFSGSTDSNGQHKLAVEYSETDRKPKCPVTISATCNVKDMNNQVMHASTSLLVHPCAVYVGIKAKKQYIKPNEAVNLSLVTTNISGLFEEDVPIKLQAVQHKVVRKKLKTVNEDVTVVDVILKSKKEALDYDLVLKSGGKYTVTAEICDQNGNINSTGMVIIVQGGSDVGTQKSRIDSDQLIVIADKSEYQLGETANIFIQSEYDERAEGLLTVVCTGNLIQQRFDMENGSCILKVPISKEMIPMSTVAVDLVASNYRVDNFLKIDKDAPKKPAFATGSVSLSVPPRINELQIDVKPKDKTCSPGSDNEVEVTVVDANGKPVADAEVTLVVVDEAVLSLTHYSIQNPLNFFYPSHQQSYTRYSSRNMVFVKDWSNIQFSAPPIDLSDDCSEDEDEDECMVMEDFAFSEMRERMSFSEMKESEDTFEEEQETEEPEQKEDSSSIKVRTDFCPLAAFETSKTEKSGKSTIKFKLPDNLTEYRVTAIAVSGATLFGIGESSIVANLPLMIRPSPPRFFNFGDKAEVAVILQNQSSNTLDVNFGIKLTNLSLIDKDQEYLHVSIPSLKRVLIKYPITTENCGKGRIQIGAEVVGGKHADAVTKEISIFTPATSEAFATYGEIDNGAHFQAILAPPNVYSQFGGLEITTSSTAVQALTDAFLYLINYWYECIEQTSSRLLSICALENVLYAFNVPEMPSKSSLRSNVNRSIKKLQNAQRSDGSFGFWTLTSEPNVFLSIHVAHCLQQCVSRGYEVSSTTISRSKLFLSSVEDHLKNRTYCEITKFSLRAKALHVLTIMDEKKDLLKKAKDLFKEAGVEKLSLDGLAWIAVAIFKSSKKVEPEVDKILKYISNRVIESPETASFTTSYGENNDAQLVMLHSDRRTDAIVLDSLIEIDPKNSLIPKIVKGLMKHKKKGRWGSTSENVFILLAMNKYFEVYEKTTPDFICKMWMGEQFAGEQIFKGRSTDKNLVKIPMSFIAEAKEKENTFIIQKEGDGRLYYRIGMNYAPKSLEIDPLSYGFIVERTYHPVSNDSDVVKNKDGSWTFKSGELVKVELTMSTTQVRYHVALVDQLPAGLEALNPDLPIGGSENVSQSSGFSWWYGYWFEHQNFRDERVEAFASYLYPSVHKYSYLARATTAGEFIAPPAQAEEMYSPEVFGRSKSEKIFIK
eukprot:gene7936-12405_t